MVLQLCPTCRIVEDCRIVKDSLDAAQLKVTQVAVPLVSHAMQGIFPA